MKASDFKKGDRIRLSAAGLARMSRGRNENVRALSAQKTGVIAYDPTNWLIYTNRIPVIRTGARKSQLFLTMFWELDD